MSIVPQVPRNCHDPKRRETSIGLWRVRAGGDYKKDRLYEARLYGRITRQIHGWPGIKRSKDDPCWLWAGSKSNSGQFFAGERLSAYPYGRVSVRGTMRSASRVLWELTYGPADGNLRNTCGHVDCVKPDHWQPCTYKAGE